jgi:adenylate cyclase
VLCSSCGHENREGKRFCVECGTALARRCPSCSAEAEADEKFCGECGTPLGTGATHAAPAPTPAAVRKTVTVLFADLGGSTGFGERTDAEIARQVLARYHALLQEVIDAHAGTVAKFMGDGMMATFNSRGDQDDHAVRAAGAALALQREIEPLADANPGWPRMRIGINSGESTVREMGGHGFVAYTVVGDTVNTAARLEGKAPLGGVLIGEGTLRLLPDGTRVEAMLQLQVKGREAPVDAYRLLSMPG